MSLNYWICSINTGNGARFLKNMASTRKRLVVKKPKTKNQNKSMKLVPRKKNQQNRNQQPQKTIQNRRKRGNRRQQTNNTQYGGPFNMQKGASRDYRCVVAEETIGLQASNDSANFGVLNVYNINPGNAITFPLLSQEAAVFETYKFEYLEFYSVPSVSGYAAGGQTGSVSLSVDFNASHAQPISYTAAVDLDPADEDLPCNDLRIILPPEKMHAQNIAKFIRTGGLPGSSDIKTYDVGNLFVCAEGLSATQFNVNRLYCRYKCHLYTRVDVAGAGAPQNNSVTALFDNAAALTSTVSYQPVLTTAASATVVSQNGLGVVNTAGSIVPPAGNYLLTVNVNFIASGENITYGQLTVVKNANILDFGQYFMAGTGVESISLNQTTFISCNGTDALTVPIKATFGTGTVAAYTIFTLVAI